MIIILKVFPLYILTCLTFLSLIATIIFKNQDSNCFSHLYSWQQSSSHNLSVWGKTQVLVDAEFLRKTKSHFFCFFCKILFVTWKFLLLNRLEGTQRLVIWTCWFHFPHKGMILRVFLCTIVRFVEPQHLPKKVPLTMYLFLVVLRWPNSCAMQC